MNEEGGITAREYLLAIIAANDRRYAERFDAQGRALEAALEAARTALDKAELATEKRFDAVNEFRASLADQARSFLPRGEYEGHHSTVVEGLEALSARLAAIEGTRAGTSQTIAWIAAGFGALIAVVSIVVAIVFR